MVSKITLVWAIIAGSVTVVAWLLVSWQLAVGAILGAILSWLPVLSNHIQNKRRSQRTSSSIKRAFAVLKRLSKERFGTVHRDSDDTEFVESISGSSKFELQLLNRIVDYASTHWFSERIKSLIPTQSMSMLILYLAMNQDSGPLRKSARRALMAKVSDDMTFGTGGAEFSDQVECFLRLASALNVNHTIRDEDQLIELSKRKTTRDGREQVTKQITDPQIAFLVYQLRKGRKLEAIASKNIDFLKFRKSVIGRHPVRRPTRFFLILKQERKESLGGLRLLKKGIDGFEDRIITRGNLYAKRLKDPQRFQSISIVKSRLRQESALSFAEDTFSVNDIPESESKRASFVTFPLIVEDAYYFPTETQLLDELNRKHMEVWMDFFELRRMQYKGLVLENEIRFIDLVSSVVRKVAF